MPVAPSTRLDRYEVSTLSGVGGMGEVYLAHDTKLVKTCAPEAPAELERNVTKALAKDAKGRYQTLKDVAIDLRRLKRELEVEAG